MKYSIFSSTAPAMPKPSKGTEFCKLLLSQASKDMREPLVPMAIPALAAHLSDVELMYCDNKYYELCGQMGHLIGPSGIGKAQLTHLIEAIMRSARDHDEVEYKRLSDWIRLTKTKGANKEKPEHLPRGGGWNGRGDRLLYYTDIAPLLSPLKGDGGLKFRVQSVELRVDS